MAIDRTDILPKKLIVHGHLTINKEKMSKSIGNVMDPIKIISEYGSDSLRFFLLRECRLNSDTGNHDDIIVLLEFTMKLFHDTYDTFLSNQFGNLISRLKNVPFDASFNDDREEQKLIDPDLHGIKVDSYYRKNNRILQ